LESPPAKASFTIAPTATPATCSTLSRIDRAASQRLAMAAAAAGFCPYFSIVFMHSKSARNLLILIPFIITLSKVPGFGNSIAAIMCSVGPAAIIYEKTVISHFGVNR
jgi:hypothetical protein